MINKVLLAPYYWALRFRHFLYDKGIKKSNKADVPTISIGNVTVGGTGKTPHTEMIIRTLLANEEWSKKNIAVLSRGYKRKSKGFQQVTHNGSAKFFGDEPMQIKNKFPNVTVAVDKNRTRSCDFLAHPEKLTASKKGKKCVDKDFPKADVIILDDAFQHRALSPSLSIVLIDSGRPIFNDYLLPIGSLRDIPERVSEADIVIVSKCMPFMHNWEKIQWGEYLGLKNFDAEKCTGVRKDGSIQNLFFTTIDYDTPRAAFEEGDSRFLYSKRLILFTGIANDTQLFNYLSSTYKIISRMKFPDHHKFTRADIRKIQKIADEYPTSVIMTTEKDAQRLKDCKNVPQSLRHRLFYAPIKARFLTENGTEVFDSILLDALK